jgi:ParB-like chromosome segregation protein Spo0J
MSSKPKGKPTPALLLPVSNVRLVPRDTLVPNDYNPNIVLQANLDLLERSILTNGWTLPIVVRPDMTIIDGYHRWTVAGREPLKSKLDGMVPVVFVQHEDPAANIYGTITHNRARGVHQLGPMKSIVKSLIAQGKTIAEIGTQLGMRPEEVFRLSDFSRQDFLALMAGGATAYSPAKLFIRL